MTPPTSALTKSGDPGLGVELALFVAVYAGAVVLKKVTVDDGPLPVRVVSGRPKPKSAGPLGSFRVAITTFSCDYRGSTQIEEARGLEQ